MDSLQFASSSDDCQVQCDSEATFNCRAYTYTNNRCFLSGDDSVSLGPIVLPEKPGATYGEKKCVLGKYFMVLGVTYFLKIILYSKSSFFSLFLCFQKSHKIHKTGGHSYFMDTIFTVKFYA